MVALSEMHSSVLDAACLLDPSLPNITLGAFRVPYNLSADPLQPGDQPELPPTQPNDPIQPDPLTPEPIPLPPDTEPSPPAPVREPNPLQPPAGDPPPGEPMRMLQV